MRYKNLVSFFLAIVFTFSICLSSAESRIIISDLSQASDEELEEARLQIVQEQHNRIITKIVLDKNEVIIKKGGTDKITPSIEGLTDDLKAGKFVWTSDDTSIVTVQNGTIRGISAGKATISCSSILSNGIEIVATCLVTVNVDIKSISFENKNVIVQFGENYQQVPKITPEESTNKDLLYSSSDENVAKVDEHGLVTILSAGKATITATSTDGSNKSASYSISVPTFSSPDKFTATKAKDSFVVDYLGSDDINNITVKSNNNSIASVFYTIWSKEDNKVYISVEPKKVGTTTFVISDKTNPSIKSEVEITVPDTAITIPFNASKISKMFQKNGEEWLFEQQINSSDIITSRL